MVALRFAVVFKERMNKMKENAIPKSSKGTAKSGVTLFEDKIDFKFARDCHVRDSCFSLLKQTKTITIKSAQFQGPKNTRRDEVSV